MKHKLRILVNAAPSLKALSELKFPAKTVYAVARFLKVIGAELTTYEEVRIQKAKEYGTLSEDGQSYQFDKEVAEKFNKELEALLDTEVEIPFELLKQEALEDIEFEAKHLVTLFGLAFEE